MSATVDDQETVFHLGNEIKVNAEVRNSRIKVLRQWIKTINFKISDMYKPK